MPTVDDVPVAVEAIQKEMSKKGWVLADEPDNRFENPIPKTNYRDLNMIWKSPDGFLVELHVNTLSTIRAKEGPGHKLYEQFRPIKERTDLIGFATEEEKREMKRLADAQKELYDAAYADPNRPA